VYAPPQQPLHDPPWKYTNKPELLATRYFWIQICCRTRSCFLSQSALLPGCPDQQQPATRLSCMHVIGSPVKRTGHPADFP